MKIKKILNLDDPEVLKKYFKMDNVLIGGHLNPMVTKISGGRIAMVNTQTGQYVPTLDAEPMQLTTGCEEDYAEWCHDIRIKSDEKVRITAIIDKYRPDNDKVYYNPERTVVYIGLETGRYGSVNIPSFISHHTSFGFRLNVLEAKLVVGNVLQPEEILATSPSRGIDGNFKYGREVNTAYLGTFGTNEDGAEAAYSVKDMYKFELYQTIDIFVESNQCLLNLFGDEYYYKPIPSIGDRLNSSGLVAAKRELERAFGLINTKRDELRKVRRPFDHEIYSHPDGEVVDITVIKGSDRPSDVANMPKGQVQYLDALAENYNQYNRKVLELDRNYETHARRNTGMRYVRDGSWHIKVRDSEKLVGARPSGKGKAVPTINDLVISGYFIRITIRKIGSPRLGYKFTGKQGEKYVICNFKPDHEMACDKWGRFAHFHVNPVGVVNRNNPSQLFECFITDACFHTRNKMLEMYETGCSFEQLWEFLIEFYRRISPRTHDIVTRLLPEANRTDHIVWVLQNRIDLEEPVGGGWFGYNCMKALRDTPYWPPHDVVTVGKLNGTLVTTHNKVRVSNKYIFPLEKIGSDSSACSLSIRQSTGFPAKINSKQKKTSQMSNTANRVFGESEFRDLFSKVGSKIVRTIILTHSSATAAKHMAMQMFEKVGFIDSDKIPKTESRGLSLLRHILSSFGFDLSNKDEHDDRNN